MPLYHDLYANLWLTLLCNDMNVIQKYQYQNLYLEKKLLT